MSSTDDESVGSDAQRSSETVTDSNKSGLGTIKFSLSLPSKASVKPRTRASEDRELRHDEEKLEYLNEIDPNKPIAKNYKVIPKLENSWRPMKKTNDIQMTDSDVKFEAEGQATGIESDMEYGLNLRNGVQSVDGHDNGEHNIEELFLSKDELEKRRFREDIKFLPEEVSPDAYERMPVEEFGEAVLRGMGWSECRGIGLNAKEPVAPFQFARRVGRLGLGATLGPPRDKPS
eukprot:Gb_22528 [translate_table: standard]